MQPGREGLDEQRSEERRCCRQTHLHAAFRFPEDGRQAQQETQRVDEDAGNEMPGMNAVMSSAAGSLWYAAAPH
ncbi:MULTISPECIES: hypothetical protein [unclassified Streptomyces]|uniref:hypothetical protein n=1 Tax=unclassified Streptomyces TaxID=2593676 RepID=UPI001319EF43|nr:MULTISPECIES: hypothetical protein [unclassified Streptomyces]MYT30413.1 hypothetical protein [Streptomyces sp. SID8354]